MAIHIETGRRHKVVPIGCGRTPILSMARTNVSARQLGAAALNAVIDDLGLRDRSSKIGALVAGQVAQDAFDSNIAKHIARSAHLPDSVHCQSVNRQCSSSMDAANIAWELIASGKEKLVIVVGVEAMANSPYLVHPSARDSKLNRWLRGKSGKWRWLAQNFGISKHYGPGVLFGSYGHSGLATLENALDPKAANMTKTAQIVSNLCNISRSEADRLADLSHARAVSGRSISACDIVPFYVPGVGLISEDENVRPKSRAAGAKPLPDTGGLVTAANASNMGGCGVALVLATPEMADELGVTPLAEIVDFQASGFDANAMGLGPVPAVEQLLSRHQIKNSGGQQRQLSVADIDYWEVNEAFAAVWAAIMKVLGINEDRCNLYGGGISLGHPLGSTGVRMLNMIIREVHERNLNLAVATQCAAGGMGTAVMVQKFVKETRKDPA